MPATAHPLAQQNLLDKAIAYLSPRLAGERMAARAQLALAGGGGYTGARLDRAALARYLPTAGSPTTDAVRDLPTLRARSRDQMRNAPVAVGALNTTVGNVVGTGLALTPSVNANRLGLDQEEADAWQAETRERWEAWALSVDCDLSRTLNFYGLQELAFRSALESGDVFVVTPRPVRAGRGARLALQLLEGDRVCNPERKANTPTLIEGVEIAPDTGEALAYHIADRHPADSATPCTWARRAARGANGRRNVIHLFKPLRPGMVRGVPWIAPVIEPLKQLGRYTDLELQAAVVSGIYSVFIKMDPNAFAEMFDEEAQSALVSKASNWSGEMEGGQAVNLLPGESVETSNPGRPNAQFDPFVTSILRQIGMALELPYEVLVMHYQSSYTAARGALLMAWKFFRSRRDWLATYLCQPIYELWLSEEVAEGRIACPGFFADDIVRAAWCGATWTGDGPGSIDPQKEVAAAKARVEMEISTLDAESLLHDGVDWATKHRRRAREIAEQKRDGTYVTPAGAAAPAPAAQEDTAPTRPAQGE